jgi:hypothetical protein
MIMLKIWRQCTMCHWPKCELVSQLIFFSKIIYGNLVLFSMTKNDLKFNISYTLGLNISKSRSLNPTQWVPSNNNKNVPKFSYNLLLPCYLCSNYLITLTNIDSSGMLLQRCRLHTVRIPGTYYSTCSLLIAFILAKHWQIFFRVHWRQTIKWNLSPANVLLKQY